MSNIVLVFIQKIVEEERMLYQNSTVMPALTLCVFPGLRDQKGDGDPILMEFDQICPNSTDFKKCIDKSR